MKFIGQYITATEPAWTTTFTPGVFTLKDDVEELKLRGQWPRGPVAPTNLAASGSNNQIALTWTAPATTHGTLTNYLITHTPSGGSATSVLTGNTNTSYALTGLTNGISHSIQVAGVNFKRGDYSSTVIATPQATIQPVFLANGYLSVLRTETIPDSEFPNAVLANGYLSVLRTETIPDSEFPNAVLANGYLSVLYTDII